MIGPKLGGDNLLQPGWSWQFSAFLTDLKVKVERSPISIIMVGDFNLISYHVDKSLASLDIPCMQLFNDCITEMALWEVARVVARFTWTNKQHGSGVSCFGS